MSRSRKRSRSQSRRRKTSARDNYVDLPYRNHVMALLVVLVVVLLGGGAGLAAQGFWLLAVGAFLVAFPPLSQTGRLLSRALAALLVVGLAGFLPRFGAAPEWWQGLTTDLGVDLPPTLTPQPWVTGEAWVLLLSGVAWTFLMLNLSREHREQRSVLFLVMAGIGLLALGVVVGSLIGMRYLLAPDAVGFSYFPNPNQTGALMGVGCVLAFIHTLESIKKTDRRFFVGLVTLLLTGTACILAHSRGAVLFTLFGIGLWVALRVICRPAAGAYRVGASLLVGAGMLFLVFGGDTRDRTFRALTLDAEREMPFDYRVQVYEDTLSMVADQPLQGVGLGNFEALFPRYQEVSPAGAAILHPESDWLWVAAELGMPGLLALGAALIGFFLCSGSLKRGPLASHRIAVVSALSVLILHSLVDVGGHHLSIIGLGLLLGSLLMSNRVPARPIPVPYPVWRWGGLVLAGIGALWLAGAVFQLPTHTRVIAENSRAALQRHADRDDPGAVARAADLWTRLEPVSWRPWFAWGRAHLRAGGEPPVAERAFRISRFLQPEVARLPFLEGVAWIGHDSGRVVNAWRHALAGVEANRPELLGRMAHLGLRRPELREGLIGLSGLDPQLRAQVYPKLDDPAFFAAFTDDLSDPALLEAMPAGQLLRFSRRFVELGGGDQLRRSLDRESDGLKDSLSLRAVALAGLGDYKAAMDLVRSSVDRPPLPEPVIGKSLLKAQREFKNDPEDVMRGVLLFRLQVERSLWSEALETSQRLMRLPDCPAYIPWWRGEILYAREDYAAAWAATARYLQQRAEARAGPSA
ncbi:MAG: O-antigen ligase family protein [Opitutales bacterium]